MAKPYNITITNGEGSANVLNDSYSVESNVTGYLNTSIDPKTIEVVEGTNEYQLSISADGAFTLHVTETGETSGTPIVGAKFARCDSAGVTYGNEITTNENGEAVFQNVPYDANNAPTIYYKQISGDGTHAFDDTLKNTTLESSTKTVEVINALPALRTFKLADANYNGLPIENGSITLS